MIYFSPKNQGFYPESLRQDYGSGWPTDAAALSVGEHSRIRQALDSGAVIDSALAASYPETVIRVPKIVSRAQGIRALYDAGALDSIEAAVAASDRASQLAWASVSEFHRDSPMIARLGGGLDLDALFIYAKTIKL
jgi:hypothetical protein